MSPTLAALAVAGVVVGAWLAVPAAPARRRPARERADLLVALGSPLACAAARSIGRVPGSVSPALARTTALSVLFAAAGLVVSPWAAAAAVLPWVLARARTRSAGQRELALVAEELPEVIDLLALVVGAGATPAEAVAAVARRGDGPIAAALGSSVRRASSEDLRLADALATVPERLGTGAAAVRPLLGVLSDAVRHGTALGPALDRLGADARVRRRHRAEARARRVPVLLLFPLVTCTLPALGLLTVAPLLVGTLRSLRQ